MPQSHSRHDTSVCETSTAPRNSHFLQDMRAPQMSSALNKFCLDFHCDYETLAAEHARLAREHEELLSLENALLAQKAAGPLKNQSRRGDDMRSETKRVSLSNIAYKAFGKSGSATASEGSTSSGSSSAGEREDEREDDSQPSIGQVCQEDQGDREQEIGEDRPMAKRTSRRSLPGSLPPCLAAPVLPERVPIFCPGDSSRRRRHSMA